MVAAGTLVNSCGGISENKRGYSVSLKSSRSTGRILPENPAKEKD